MHLLNFRRTLFCLILVFFLGIPKLSQANEEDTKQLNERLNFSCQLLLEEQTDYNYMSAKADFLVTDDDLRKSDGFGVSKSTNKSMNWQLVEHWQEVEHSLPLNLEGHAFGFKLVPAKGENSEYLELYSHPVISKNDYRFVGGGITKAPVNSQHIEVTGVVSSVRDNDRRDSLSIKLTVSCFRK